MIVLKKYNQNNFFYFLYKIYSKLSEFVNIRKVYIREKLYKIMSKKNHKCQRCGNIFDRTKGVCGVCYKTLL